MFSKKNLPDFFRTIAFRMSLWYTLIFFICSCAGFAVLYVVAVNILQDQVDRELQEQAGHFSQVIARQGMAGARNLAIREAQAAGEKKIFFRLLYPTGEVFASSYMAHWQGIGVDETLVKKLMLQEQPLFDSILVKSRDMAGSKQSIRVLYAFIAPRVILQTGIVTDFSFQFLGTVQKVFLVYLVFSLVFCSVSAWFLVKKALSRVETIRKTAQDITGANLEQRVPASSSMNEADELDKLAGTFNQMLDRIEHLVSAMGQMNDDIAHDLKSPLTRIRGLAELSLTQQNPSLLEYQAMAAGVIEESDRLLDMINTMLVISRADAGQGEFDMAQVDVSALIRDACELFVPVAEDKNISCTMDIPLGLYLWADKKLLQRAFSNILDNALKYTPVGGKVDVKAFEAHDEAIHIQVEDTGPGIAPEYADKIFDRFFRLDSSRTTQGSGLGLSLARTIARQHGGDITVAPVNGQGQGAVFTIRLPYCNPGVM